MNRKMLRDRREAPRENAEKRWAMLIENDVAGIDGDIDKLVGLYQMKYGYTRQKANVELVRKLSSLVTPGAALSED
jgi:hypothetical protein